MSSFHKVLAYQLYMLKMSNSRFIQSFLWALHNNYVDKYGFKNINYLSIGCVRDILYSKHLKIEFLLRHFRHRTLSG